MPTSDAGRDDALGDTGRDGAFDDGRNGIHGADDFGLELRRDVEFDLLEEVLRSSEAADDKDILGIMLVFEPYLDASAEHDLLEAFDFEPE